MKVWSEVILSPCMCIVHMYTTHTSQVTSVIYLMYSVTIGIHVHVHQSQVMALLTEGVPVD